MLWLTKGRGRAGDELGEGLLRDSRRAIRQAQRRLLWWRLYLEAEIKRLDERRHVPEEGAE
jgi:hypothetical protein